MHQDELTTLRQVDDIWVIQDSLEDERLGTGVAFDGQRLLAGFGNFGVITDIGAYEPDGDSGISLTR